MILDKDGNQHCTQPSDSGGYFDRRMEDPAYRERALRRWALYDRVLNVILWMGCGAVFGLMIYVFIKAYQR